MPAKAPKIAIVHDWLTNMGGAEPLVLEIHKLFPKAPIYTSVYDVEKMPAFKGIDVRTTNLQTKLPKKLRYKHILWPTFRAKAFRQLNLSEFDIIISSSSAEAKAIRKSRPDQVHIAYIHTPPRYYWSHYEEFRREFSFGPFTPFIRPVIPYFVKKMRKLDRESVKDIDIFIANSTVTQERIKEYYDKPSTIIYPPVNIDRFTPPPKGDRHGYVIWGRHVPYKRFDLAIQAANKLNAELTIAGTGPDTERLKSLASPTVKFVGRISDAELVKLAQTSKAFLFPNEEDFGISAVEALAAGTPVIAYKKGGALDIVQDGETGVFFEEQTVKSLVEAMKRFEAIQASDLRAFSPATLHRKAKRFDKGLFDTKILKIVGDYAPPSK
ncbi:MAG TPA: glycosyltransferase [Dongiaceae bacterium]|nr:glycosyltransferase [Dongiaceae bacterium]